jgi:hypothetical protein
MKKMMEVSMLHECSSILSWKSKRQYAPDLGFSAATYVPTDLDSNFSELFVHRFCKRTKSPTSSSRSLTFESLHALVSSWYLCRLAIALSLSGFNKSLPPASLGHAQSSAVVCMLRCFTSSSHTASVEMV